MRRLILFAKRGEAGRVKTRLTPPLSRDQAARLYRGFVADGLDLLARFRAAGCQVECCTDRLPLGQATHGIDVTLQPDGDLGARMQDALSRAQGAGATRTIILGADAPTLPDILVEQAFACLEQGADAVITPADDGGYILVGAARPVPALFRNIPWGNDGVLAATRAAAAENKLRLDETDGWYDIDRPHDLVRLDRELSASGEQVRAPHTRRALRAVWTAESGSC